MLTVGLTGGVASGKTAASQVLKEEGAYVIDADKVSRELVQPHTSTWNELIRVFGEDIVQKDGSIDRKKLAARVFSNGAQRKLLNQILHPRIREEMERRTREIGQRNPEAIVVIDAALLVELGDYREMDKVIVVTATEKQQVERLKDRDGMDPEDARKILSSQMPLEEKLKAADFVIRNEGSLEEMRRRAKEIFKELKSIAVQKKDRPQSQRPSK